MKGSRRDIQFHPVESSPTGASFDALSPRKELEAQEQKTRSSSTDLKPRNGHIHTSASEAAQISPVRERALANAKSNIGINPVIEATRLPRMPEQLEDFPTPRHVYTQAMESFRERLEQSEPIRSLDLIATHESYNVRDIDREEALRNIEKLADKLKLTRDKHGDKRMMQSLLKEMYSKRGYTLSQNTMLGLFTGSERGNCEATAKAVGTMLEEVGLDPQTDISYQYYSDHIRTLAKLDDRWHVLEGRLHPLKDKDLEGTMVCSAEDSHRMFLGLPTQFPISDNRKSYHQEDGSTLNKGLLSWIKKGLHGVDAAIGRKFKTKSNPMHRAHGEKAAAPLGLTNTISLIGSLLPSTRQTRRAVIVSLAAAGFFYGTKEASHPDVHNLEDLTEAIHDDVESVQETTTTVIESIAEFTKRELKGLKESVTLEPKIEPPPDKNKADGKDPDALTAQGVTREQIHELDRRFAAYYGAAHYILGNPDVKVSETSEGFQMTISVQPEARTIGDDLYRYFLRQGYGDINDGLPSNMIINFQGDRLALSRREKQKLQKNIESIYKFRPDKDPNEPFPIYLEFQINGEKIGSVGEPSEERELTSEVEEFVLSSEVRGDLKLECLTLQANVNVSNGLTAEGKEFLLTELRNLTQDIFATEHGQDPESLAERLSMDLHRIEEDLKIAEGERQPPIGFTKESWIEMRLNAPNIVVENWEEIPEPNPPPPTETDDSYKAHRGRMPTPKLERLFDDLNRPETQDPDETESIRYTIDDNRYIHMEASNPSKESPSKIIGKLIRKNIDNLSVFTSKLKDLLHKESPSEQEIPLKETPTPDSN